MIRAHAQVKSKTPLQLIYSARTPADVMYAQELAERARLSPATVATLLYTRLTRWPGTPAQLTKDTRVTDPEIKLPGYAGRLSGEVLAQTAFPPELTPAIYACGPNGFVETAAALLQEAGYNPATIKTERFG